MKKYSIASLLLFLILTSCNDLSIIEGISAEDSKSITKLSAGSFIAPPPDYTYSIQYTLFLKNDLNVGKLDVSYTLVSYNISKAATIYKYYPTDVPTCSQATESTVILDLNAIVKSNPNILNTTMQMTVKATAENGKTFSKTVNVKVNYCYFHNIDASELQ